jgi:hypothetical protein
MGRTVRAFATAPSAGAGLALAPARGNAAHCADHLTLPALRAGSLPLPRCAAERGWGAPDTSPTRLRLARC